MKQTTSYNIILINFETLRSGYVMVISLVIGIMDRFYKTKPFICLNKIYSKLF